jgi:hypothetical protein
MCIEKPKNQDRRAMTHQNKRQQTSESDWRKQCARWLKRHKAIVTIVSALTVLTSFAINETLDEPAKDRLSALQEAVRDNNTEQVELYTQLTDINANLHILKDKVMEGKEAEASEFQRMKFGTENTKALELLGQNMAHLVALRQVLSPSFERKKDAFDDKYRTLQSTEKTDTVDALAKSVRDWEELYNELRIHRGEGVEELGEHQKSTELRHHWHSWITYLGMGGRLLSSLVGSNAGSGND